MHHFLHGITRSFLAACGGSLLACLPALELLGEVAENISDQHDGDPLPAKEDRGHEGDLLPQNGEDEEGQDAQEPSSEPDENEGASDPYEGQATNSEFPAPVGQAISAADSKILPSPHILAAAPHNGQATESIGRASSITAQAKTAAAMNLDEEEDIPAYQEGQFKHKEGNELTLRPTIGATHNGDLSPFLVYSPHIDVVHEWKQVLLTYMHGEIGGHGKASMAHDDVVIVHAKPRVDPKVKKKTSLLLCLSIDMPFHPGEHGHDGTPPSRHHKPCSSLCLYIECSCPSVYHSPHLSSTSTFFLRACFPNEAKDAAKEVLHANTLSIHLPFTPLRGRKGYQAHERQFQVKMVTCTGSQTKPKTLMQMRLFYLTKDVLDPG